MRADLYAELSNYDDTGQISRSWVLDKTIDCYAYSPSISGTSFSSNEKWDRTYDYEVVVKLKTRHPVLLSDQVANIVDASGRLLWGESDGHPTKFNVYGVIPITSPLGEFVEYGVLLRRAEVQNG